MLFIVVVVVNLKPFFLLSASFVILEHRWLMLANLFSVSEYNCVTKNTWLKLCLLLIVVVIVGVVAVVFVLLSVVVFL